MGPHCSLLWWSPKLRIGYISLTCIPTQNKPASNIKKPCYTLEIIFDTFYLAFPGASKQQGFQIIEYHLLARAGQLPEALDSISWAPSSPVQSSHSVSTGVDLTLPPEPLLPKYAITQTHPLLSQQFFNRGDLLPPRAISGDILVIQDWGWGRKGVAQLSYNPQD